MLFKYERPGPGQVMWPPIDMIIIYCSLYILLKFVWQRCMQKENGKEKNKESKTKDLIKFRQWPDSGGRIEWSDGGGEKERGRNNELGDVRRWYRLKDNDCTCIFIVLVNPDWWYCWDDF